MPRGPSGRIVVELNPALKREFHAALAADGITLKDWFLSRACDFITNRQRPQLLDAGSRVLSPSRPLQLPAEKRQKVRPSKSTRTETKGK
jgi:hypothetical protein